MNTRERLSLKRSVLKTTNKNDSVVLKDDDDDDTSKKSTAADHLHRVLNHPGIHLWRTSSKANRTSSPPTLKKKNGTLVGKETRLATKSETERRRSRLFYLRQSTSTALFGKLFLMDTEEEEEEEQYK